MIFLYITRGLYNKLKSVDKKEQCLLAFKIFQTRIIATTLSRRGRHFTVLLKLKLGYVTPEASSFY